MILNYMYISTNLHNHLATSLVPFSVVCLLLYLLYHPFSAGSVLKGKFTNSWAHFLHFNFLRYMLWETKPQEESLEPCIVRKTAVSIFAICTFLLIKNVLVSAICLLISKCYLSYYTYLNSFAVNKYKWCTYLVITRR